MKWRTELNGEGHYWWEAETPIGPVYVAFSDYTVEREKRTEVRWYPMDEGDGIVLGLVATEDSGKELAATFMRKLAKKMARFAK